MSERVTWEPCPRCGTLAALGWRGGTLVHVDCPGDCRVACAEFVSHVPRRVTFQFPAPVAPRKIDAETGLSWLRSAPSPPDGAPS